MHLYGRSKKIMKANGW